MLSPFEKSIPDHLRELDSQAGAASALLANTIPEARAALNAVKADVDAGSKPAAEMVGLTLERLNRIDYLLDDAMRHPEQVADLAPLGAAELARLSAEADALFGIVTETTEPRATVPEPVLAAFDNYSRELEHFSCHGGVSVATMKAAVAAFRAMGAVGAARISCGWAVPNSHPCATDLATREDGKPQHFLSIEATHNKGECLAYHTFDRAPHVIPSFVRLLIEPRKPKADVMKALDQIRAELDANWDEIIAGRACVDGPFPGCFAIAAPPIHARPAHRPRHSRRAKRVASTSPAARGSAMKTHKAARPRRKGAHAGSPVAARAFSPAA
jgi:hypothetical protein